MSQHLRRLHLGRVGDRLVPSTANTHFLPTSADVSISGVMPVTDLAAAFEHRRDHRSS